MNMGKYKKIINNILEILQKNFAPDEIMDIGLIVSAIYIAIGIKNDTKDSQNEFIEIAQNSFKEYIELAIKEINSEDLTNLIIMFEKRFLKNID